MSQLICEVSWLILFVLYFGHWFEAPYSKKSLVETGCSRSYIYTSQRRLGKMVFLANLTVSGTFNIELFEQLVIFIGNDFCKVILYPIIRISIV